MTGNDIVFDVSRDLNDQVEGYPYLRWTEDQLRSYFTEGYSSVCRIYKRDYIKQVVVSLEVGDKWYTACDCTHILRVVGESDAAGNLIRELAERDSDSIYLWPGTMMKDICPSTEKTELTHYAISTTKDNAFKVYPPIVPGYGQQYVLIECYKEPDVANFDEDIPDKFVATIKQWMLYRALIVDSENNPAIVQVAQIHLQTYQALRNQLITEAKEDEAMEKLHGNRTIRAVQNDSSK